MHNPLSLTSRRVLQALYGGKIMLIILHSQDQQLGFEGNNPQLKIPGHS